MTSQFLKPLFETKERSNVAEKMSNGYQIKICFFVTETFQQILWTKWMLKTSKIMNKWMMKRTKESNTFQEFQYVYDRKT